MTRRIEIVTKTEPDGTTRATITRRPGLLWWAFAAIFLLAALLQPNWLVRGVAGVFIALTVAMIWQRHNGRRGN